MEDDFAALQYLKEVRKTHPSWLSSEDSVLDVATTTLIAPLCLLLRSFVRSKISPKSSTSSFVLDCICLVFPIIISFTVLSSSAFRLSMVILLIIICIIKISHIQPIKSPHSKYPFSEIGIPFLNTYRAMVNLCTIIVILAVDFSKIFPPRFHKRYTNGFSLMDTGVGSFIFSHAIVCPESRFNVIKESRLQRIKNCLMSSSMLIILGCGRLFVTWLTNYSVSEDEYGKHWNFFFTLACVKVITTVILCLLPFSTIKYSWIMAIILGIGYQAYLTLFSFRDWIIIGDNGDGSYTGGFIHANRPGLFSSIGYCSLYLFGLQIGRMVFSEKNSWFDNIRCIEKLAVTAAAAGFCTWLLHSQVDKCSRMTANLTYVTWQITHNTILLLGSYVVDIICAMYSTPEDMLISGQCEKCSDRKSSPTCCCLVSAINRNQLFFFLIGNVLTGVVNLLIDTRAVSELLAVGALFTYGSVVCGVTCLLFVLNINTKFW